MNGPGPLEALPNVTPLTPRVTRILGQNPSLMTLQGTNTYLLQPPSSPSAPAILVDTTMPGDPATAWSEIVLTHLKSTSASIAHIVLTHRHVDHVGGLVPLIAGLKAAGLPAPKVWKTPSVDEATLQASEREWDRYSCDAGLANMLNELGDGAVDAFKPQDPIHPLADGSRVQVEHEGKAVGVTVVATPGHTADSVSLVVDGEDKEVFTGDTVLGQGTTIFQDFGAYMASLKRLLALDAGVLYPAHGPVIKGAEHVRTHLTNYIRHRQEREDVIVSALQSLKAEPGTLGIKLDVIRSAAADKARQGERADGHRAAGATADAHQAASDAALNSTPIAAAFPTSGEAASAATVPLLVRLVYQTGHEGLINAASRTLASHLSKLEREGRARKITATMPQVKDWVVEGNDAGDAWEWIGEPAPPVSGTGCC